MDWPCLLIIFKDSKDIFIVDIFENVTILSKVLNIVFLWGGD